MKHLTYRTIRTILLSALVVCTMISGANAASIAGGSVNLRTGPSMDHDILTTLSRGKEVAVLGEEDGWYRVSADGQEGYVRGDLISPESQGPASGNGGTITGGAAINVRTGPGIDFDRITQLSGGNRVTVLGVENGWYRISADGKEGYVLADYLIPDSGSITLLEAVGVPAPAAAPEVEPAAAAAESGAVDMDVPVQEAHMGTITGGLINIRTGPDTGYDRIMQVNTGKKVVILGEEDGWYYIALDGQIGYVLSDYLIPDDEQIEAEAEATWEEVPADGERTGIITGGTINIRTGPDTSFSSITLVRTGKRVNILGSAGEWYHVSFGDVDGYVFGKYLVEGTELPNSAIGEQVVALAQNYLGVRYVYGGSSPRGFDCSGFTSWLYAQFGYSLPHSASAQYANCGYKVSRDALQPGDLVFFSSSGHSGSITHVGMYIGNGNVIHARYSIGRIYINNLSESYYSRNYVGAKRIV